MKNVLEVNVKELNGVDERKFSSKKTKNKII